MASKKVIGLGIFVLFIMAGAIIAVNMISAPIKIENAPEQVEVTVYNQNLGVVKEYRRNFLGMGLNDVLYEGVAAQIDPTSVKLKAVDGIIDVLEQNFEYDLVSGDKILEKYIGKNITAYQIYGDNKDLIEGTLLSHNGYQLILQDRNGEIQILNSNNILLPELPEGLITKPTLRWLVDSAEAKEQTLELSYMTGGMNWKADYIVVTNDDDTEMDLNGWVTVTNNAGTTFENASLKLIAGDVNLVTSAVPYARDAVYSMGAAEEKAQFAEEGLFEYHLYDLQRRTTLKNNEQKQISLLSSEGIGVEKEYVFEGSSGWYGMSSGNGINVMLNFDNSEENKLGMPLPQGIVRVFKRDSEGQLQFIGEDSIDHTPKDETLRILVGQAFDIVGERKQMDYNVVSNWYEYTWEITLRNHKDEDITVTVLENVYGDWEITRENYKHTAESNNKIRWSVPVKKDGETKLTYTIRYKRA